MPDLIIAAVCMTEKLTLITDNVKDFPMPELTLYSLDGKATNSKPAAPFGKAMPSMVRVDGLWVHHGTPDEQADWLGVIDRARDERAQTVMGPDFSDSMRG